MISSRFRCSTLAHTAGPIRPDIVRDMQLEKHGLRYITPETCVTALSPDGRALSLYQDENNPRRPSPPSRKRCREIFRAPAIAGQDQQVIAEVLATRHPISTTQHGDLWSMLQTAAPSAISAREFVPRLRWGPMAVADLVGEYFETELLRAVIAARGIFGTFLGPWSAGSALQLLIRAAGDSHPAARRSLPLAAWDHSPKHVISRKAAGVEIRTSAESSRLRQRWRGHRRAPRHRRRNQRQGRHLQRRPQTHPAQAHRSTHLLPISYRSCNTTRQRHRRKSQPRTLGPANLNALKMTTTLR